jgi:hypothetical protein
MDDTRDQCNLPDESIGVLVRGYRAVVQRKLPIKNTVVVTIRKHIKYKLKLVVALVLIVLVVNCT